MTILKLSLLLALATSSAGAQAALPMTRLAPDLYLITSPAGNVVAETGPTGILIAGAQTAAATPGIIAALHTVSNAPIRYVLFAAGDSLATGDDAGWGARGVTLVSHERMRMTAKSVPSAIGFSEVMQIYLDGQSTHAVHQPPGHTRADFIVHFELKNVLYLGNAFIAKGYPRIDVRGGASIDSLIKEIGPFAGFNNVQMIPGRGAVSTPGDVGEYRDMLTAVRAKVGALVAAKKSLADVIAAKPTAPWDATYGRAGARPEEFVEMVYRSLAH